MREIERRLRRAEERAAERSLKLLWAGERPEDEVMLEAFGSVEEPPGLRVVLLRWADGAGDVASAAPALVVIPDPAGTVH